MTEYQIYWLVVLALSTLIGLFITVGKPIVKLNSTLTELNSRMKNVEKDISEFTDKNRDSHKHLHERIDDVEKRVDDVSSDVRQLRFDVNNLGKR